MSGASGAIYGIRLLEVLKDVADVETHLVMSDSAKLNIAVETDFSAKEVGRKIKRNRYSNNIFTIKRNIFFNKIYSKYNY